MAELLTAARARELADAWDDSDDDASGVRALDMCEALRSHADALDAGATTPPSAVAWLAKYVGADSHAWSSDVPIKTLGKIVVVAHDGVVREIGRNGQHVDYEVSLTGHQVVYRVRVVESPKP